MDAKVKTRPKTGERVVTQKPFRTWVRSCSSRDHAAVRAFIKHFQDDNSMPDVANWGELRRYLYKLDAKPEVFVVARQAWRVFVVAQRPSSKRS